MPVTFHTAGNNYNYGVSNNEGAQGASQTQLSPEYLNIIREFGLEDDAALRQSFLENPPENINYGNLLTLSNKLDGMSGSMADVFTVMLLIAQMSQENRETSRNLRDAEQQSQLTEMQVAADKIREAADFALAAGIVSGVMKMAAGAISIGGGLKGLKDLKGIDATPTTPTNNSATQPTTTPNATGTSNTANAQGTPAPTQTSADVKLEQIRAQGRIFDGSGQIVTGTGDIVSAGLTRASDEARAEEKEADARAKEHEMLAEKESDFMSFNRDMIQKVAQIMKDLIQLNSQSERAAATI